MARQAKHEEIQVVTVVAAPKKIVKTFDWTETKKLAVEIEAQASRLETLLNSLAKQTLEFHRLMKQAYEAAPEKDSGFGYAPVNGAQTMYAMKRHLLKRELRLDNIYVGDLDKVPTFVEHVREAMKWLLKFSN